jgi:Mrp family chromosome partitioning ATPase
VAILEGTGARLLGVVANKVPQSGRGAYYYASYYGEASVAGSRGKRWGRRFAARTR